MQILVAEDDPVSRRVLEHTLNKLGHVCLSARDGEEAWHLFVTCGADVILSDWMMPGLDGIELCRRVRACGGGGGAGGGSYTYFVLITALDNKEHVLSGMKAGADDHLSKPLDRDLLEARLIAAERVTALHRDLSALNRKLWHLSRHDALTGLYNRLQLRDDLADLRERVDNEGRCRAIALLDVDNFKRYNDLYGHVAGDAALRRVAQALQGEAGEGRITAYRFGGEEFCLLLADAPTITVAAAALEEVCCRVQGLTIPHAGSTPARIVTISAGLVAVAPGDNKTVDALLQEADAALYKAKKRGRNCVVTASHDARLPVTVT